MQNAANARLRRPSRRKLASRRNYRLRRCPVQPSEMSACPTATSWWLAPAPHCDQRIGRCTARWGTADSLFRVCAESFLHLTARRLRQQIIAHGWLGNTTDTHWRKIFSSRRLRLFIRGTAEPSVGLTRQSMFHPWLKTVHLSPWRTLMPPTFIELETGYDKSSRTQRCGILLRIRLNRRMDAARLCSVFGNRVPD